MDALQSNWEVIRDEALQELNDAPLISHVHREQSWKNMKDQQVNYRGWIKGWTNDPSWINYGLVYGGTVLTRNAKRCPETAKLLANIPKVIMAGFSVLRPRSSIVPHTDEHKALQLNYQVSHLGLSVPDTNKCLLVIKDEHGSTKIMNQQDGKLLQFDDRLEHSAVNATDCDRVVLYVKRVV